VVAALLRLVSDWASPPSSQALNNFAERGAESLSSSYVLEITPTGKRTGVKLLVSVTGTCLTAGGIIALRGADNYDSLRGNGLDFVVLDEFASMSPEAWTEVLRPSLADKHGRALFIGTPRGLNPPNRPAHH